MSSEHTISIATASEDGRRGTRPVSMPVDELMGSNGLVTGQSGANPATSVRRLVESLLETGETLFVVDPAGEFDGLADDSAILHVGGNRDCDVRVEPSAVDRVAALALEGSTSVVLDLSAFDAGGADELLGSLTDELLEKGRGRRSDLLVVVGECHRWLADSGPATRTGENLVELGGRRHDDVGIVGVTDQPADVREDVLSGVDWVLAHRLTWQEDVRALERMLDRHHVEALETLADDEAVFNAGWEQDVQRIQFGMDDHQTTSTAPDDDSGVDDGDDLLAGLPQARAPDAGDDDEAAAGNTTDGGVDDGREVPNAAVDSREEVAALRDQLADVENRLAALEAKLDAREDLEDVADRIADAITEGLQSANVERPRTSTRRDAGETAERNVDGQQDGSPRQDPDSTADSDETDGPGAFGDVFDTFGDDADSTAQTDSTSASAGTDDDVASANDESRTDTNPTPSENGADDGGMSFEPVDFGFDEGSRDVDSTVPEDFGPPSRHGSSGRTIPRYLRKIVRSIEEMDVTTRRMLAFYVEEGTESPMDAHVSAGGGGDRTRAYAHNRQLRTNGLIEHVGKGQYAPRLREYVVDQAGHSVPDHELDRAVDVIRQTVDEA